MGYIKDLRKYVGHSPIIMACAGVLIVNDKKQLLLQKRTDNGCWAYPGGSMELGESFKECAIREVFEETGLKCIKLEYFKTLSGKQMHYFYPNGDEVYIAETVFVCDKYEGELKVQKEEASEQRFFDIAELPDNITPMNVGVIKEFAEKTLQFRNIT